MSAEENKAMLRRLEQVVSAEENKAMLRRLLEAINTANMEVIDELFAP